MSKKKHTESEDDFDEMEDDFYDDYEDMDIRKSKHSTNARRRAEELKEERRLERMINGDYDDLDDYVDDSDSYLNNDYDDLNDNDFDDLYES